MAIGKEVYIASPVIKEVKRKKKRLTWIGPHKLEFNVVIGWRSVSAEHVTIECDRSML